MSYKYEYQHLAPEVKWSGLEADHSSPPSARVRGTTDIFTLNFTYG
jgi:hypothetical protein